MSILSKLSQSRKAAKEHKSKIAEKDELAAKPVKYRHVPTHAAIDALNNAPSTWKATDRTKIKAQHKRRSEMGISRTASAQTSLSVMNGESSSSASHPLPRINSYGSHSAAWFDRPGGESSRPPSFLGEPSQKRYKSSRAYSYHDVGIGRSPLSNSPTQSEDISPDVSPVVSSGNSTSSQSSDHLEIAGPSNPKRTSHFQVPTPTSYSEKDVFDRLHTSTTRKLGEAPVWDRPPVTVKPASPAPVITQSPKKQRWSLIGKKHNTAIAV